LREPADALARSQSLTQAIAARMPLDVPVCALDLATGAGSNLRYLIARLPGHQRWLAVDQSRDLLKDLLQRTAAWATTRGYHAHLTTDRCAILGPALDCQIETRALDLGSLDDPTIFAGRHLVTASALLDLVSDAWLRTLAAHCGATGASALFTMCYNGVSTCDPPEPEDDFVLDLFNRHQRTDKRLGGVAAGPEASRGAERCFAGAGFEVRRARSDWTLASEESDMQRFLIDGWADAAAEAGPSHAAAIRDWHARRLAHVEAGRSHIVVGHDDLAAWPHDPARPA
jgi:hypothetical protein